MSILLFYTKKEVEEDGVMREKSELKYEKNKFQLL